MTPRLSGHNLEKDAPIQKSNRERERAEDLQVEANESQSRVIDAELSLTYTLSGRADDVSSPIC
jgi:hypothetical protein